jgi:hypothetical protein
LGVAAKLDEGGTAHVLEAIDPAAAILEFAKPIMWIIS